MRIALLLFDTEDYWTSVSEKEMEEALTQHAAFAQGLRERGIAFSGEAVRPGTDARSLRPSEEGPVSADGPFVPLSQDLAGFYLIECADMGEAEEIARRCRMGAGIEIRPIWDAPS
jgi:hypothetical protein